jgi:aminopeptidase
MVRAFIFIGTMIGYDIYKKLASNAMRSLNIRDGDAVLITGGAHQQEFLEELAINIAGRGGEPFIHSVSDDYQKKYLDICTPEQLKRTPKILKGIATSMDAYITVEPYQDPAIKNLFREKLAARSRGMQPVSDIIHAKPGKRWLYIGWATEPMARMYGISAELLERLVIGGATVDYDKVSADCAKLKRLLLNVKYVHATDPYGTDIRLMIEGRRINCSDATWTQEKEEAGQLGGNLPTGEVFIAPIETYGEGKLFCPLTVDDLTRSTIIKGVTLEFKDGMLQLDKCKADNGEDVLKDTILKLAEMDNDLYGDRNALRVAEIGIGLNPAIDRAIGYILTDEKIGGSIHVAFGRNETYGGKTKSHMHWDFVTAPEITLEVEYISGEKKTLIKAGKLVK